MKRDTVMLDARMKKIIIELSDSEYVTASELAKILDLNEKTVRTTIGKMRDSLDEYGIEIESKTRKGYHLLIYDKEKYQAFINNDECLSKNDIPNNSKEREEWLLDYLLKQHKFVRIDDLSEMLYVSRSTITNDIRNVEDSLKSYHITLIRRPNYGLHIQGSEFDIRNCMISQFKDNKWAQRFSDKEENELNEKFHIHLLDSEIYYIAINIAARSDYNVLEGELESGVINQARKQATQMLDCVYDMMHLDMRQNLSLLYDLISFLIPMDIRMRYGIIAKNPFAEATKKKYFFAYNVASQAVIPLKKTYFHEVPENEIAYLTSIFALFIEQEKDKKKKYNILVICATNMSTSKLLAYQYKKKFKKYIDEVYTCEMYNLDSFDFSKVDYIFTTVEINRVLPKPVLGISAFLEDEEVEKISSILKFKSSNTIADVYSEELFYDNIKGETKEEILFEICKRIPEKYGIPSDFYEGLLRREEITGTDLAKHVALPHPYETTSDISFACISVLDHPIRWTRQDVQVVILMAVAEDEQRDLTNFLQLISEFIANESAVLQLVEEPDFTTFVNLLSQIEM